MPDYKLTEWPPPFLDNNLFTFPGTLEQESIRWVFYLYHYNIQNYRSLPFIVAKLYSEGWRSGRADAIARQELLGVITDGGDGPESDEETKVAARRMEILKR